MPIPSLNQTAKSLTITGTLALCASVIMLCANASKPDRVMLGMAGGFMVLGLATLIAYKAHKENKNSLLKALQTGDQGRALEILRDVEFKEKPVSDPEPLCPDQYLP